MNPVKIRGLILSNLALNFLLRFTAFTASLRLQSELDFAPGRDEVPAGHAKLHCNCPCWLLYVPAGHGLQSVFEDLNMPLGHLAVESQETRTKKKTDDTQALQGQLHRKDNKCV